MDKYNLTLTPFNKGSFSSIYKAFFNEKYYAIKIMKVDINKNHDIFYNEVDILSNISHPNIIKIIEFFNDKGNLCIVMDYYPLGDLHTLIYSKNALHQIKNVDEILIIMKDMLNSINYIHQNNIIHRDIKLANFLISITDSFYRTILIDFGLSKKNKFL